MQSFSLPERCEAEVLLKRQTTKATATAYEPVLAFSPRIQAYPGANRVAVTLCPDEPDIQIVARQLDGTEHRSRY